jgi:hypothetical protein
VVDAEEGQEVGCLFGPNVVWRHNVAIQLQVAKFRCRASCVLVS